MRACASCSVPSCHSVCVCVLACVCWGMGRVEREKTAIEIFILIPIPFLNWYMASDHRSSYICNI